MASLPGVGVAYKLAEALYSQAGQAGAAVKHLDLVALGIVADVAVQTDDTRYLLQRGLEALRNTQRLGLQELIKLAGINPARLTAEHIGFGIAPRLNALGRLSDANPIVEFFTTNNTGAHPGVGVGSVERPAETPQRSSLRRSPEPDRTGPDVVGARGRSFWRGLGGRWVSSASSPIVWSSFIIARRY